MDSGGAHGGDGGSDDNNSSGPSNNNGDNNTSPNHSPAPEESPEASTGVQVIVIDQDSSSSHVECPLCLKEFPGAAAADKHMRAVHLNLRPYKCDWCGHCFVEMSNLRYHIRARHNNGS